jgi:flagellar basal-body rod modification protein FlgD
MASTGSINPAAAMTTSTSSQLPTSKAQDQKNQFLQLLVAQLKGQNPLDPLDGTQFVTQLAQFSSVEELTNIHAVLDNVHSVLTNVEGFLKDSAQRTASTSSIFGGSSQS